MKIGITGFPGTGKTTIFNALTGLAAETGPGARQKENMGAIKVPDPRVDELSRLHASKKTVYAEVVFVDVAGTPGAAPSGQGLEPQVLAAMRQCDVLVIVLRAFDNPALPDAPNPVRERDAFLTEMILSDLGPLENRKERIKKDAGRKDEVALLDRCIAHLEGEAPLATLSLTPAEWAQLSGFGLLTTKPLLYLLNQAEEDFTGELPADVAALAASSGAEIMPISGKIEMDIATMAPEEQAEFLEALGLTTSARDRFVQRAYALLDLISFLTTGEDESRAWPIARGTNAQHAAGKIHSDIERGFIRAEVVAYDELVALGSEKKAKDAGKMRLEGKEYVVHDGDVINFRFNV